MAKHSDPDPDSQVLGSSSESLLLPSEPPDIINWFSSYVYESPESNIIESLREESNDETEDNLGEIRRLGKKDDFIVDQKIDYKWLFNLENRVGNKNYGNQVLDSSDSLAISSEHNINNWFSSYVYESPTLDTSEDFGFSDFKVGKVDGEGCNTGKRSKVEEDLREYVRYGKNDGLVGEKASSTGPVLRNSSGESYICKVNQGVDENSKSSVQDNLPYIRISEKILDKQRTQNHHDCSTKTFEKSITHIAMLGRTIPLEGSQRSLGITKGGGNTSVGFPRESIHKIVSTENCLRAEDDVIVTRTSVSDFTVMNRNSSGKSYTSNEKDNNGDEFGAKGFISLKKKTRLTEEDSMKRPIRVRAESSRNGRTEKDGILKRKVLAEITNFQQPDLLGVTGKWKCPQKSKPNLGPPLKQLRLERWVHRV